MPTPNLNASFNNLPLNSTPQTSPSHIPRTNRPPSLLPSSPPKANTHDERTATDSDDVTMSEGTRPESTVDDSVVPPTSTTARRRPYRRRKHGNGSPLKARPAGGGKKHSNVTVKSIYTSIRQKSWSVSGFVEAWILEEGNTESQK